MTPSQDMNHRSVPGWGADLDVKNRPAYPKERTPPRYIHPHWASLDQQPQKVKIYHSIERPTITPVFGSSTPPRGLSEKVRDVAYKLSESDLRHWFLLLFADRINVVEGLFSDLARGRFPNILAEMGIRSEFKYNRAALIRKVGIATGILGVAYFMISQSRKQVAGSRS